MAAHPVLVAIALALSAAVAHAVWNVLLKAQDDPLRLATRAVSLTTAITAPAVVIGWFLAQRPGVPPEAWLLAVVSSVAETAYFVFLSRAYRLGELSVVYPIARGTAPVLLVASGVLLLGERLGGPSLLGIVLLIAGMLAIRPPLSAGAALVPALLTGVSIATYSTIDRVGVRLAPPWLYGWLLWLFASIFLLGLSRFRRAAAAQTISRSQWYGIGLIGLLMSLAYLLVLFALSLAPVALIGPVRESSVVLVTGWGIWRLREGSRAWLKLGGAITIVAGLALVALASS